eukprot:scaffold200815_cov53-Cyclotella_meneghiniana.AAC.3
MMIQFHDDDDDSGFCEADFQLVLDEEEYDRSNLSFLRLVRDLEEWNRLGAAIGRSTSLCTMQLTSVSLNEDNNLSIESKKCMEAVYRGMETNSSLERLNLDVDLFPDDDSLPIMNLHDAQFKISLQHFNLCGSMSDSQSFTLSSFIENISLESFIMKDINVQDISESAFRRVVLACLNVKELQVHCEAASHYATVAALLQNPRSILSQIYLCGELDSIEGVSTIAAGLTNNTSLETLRSCGHGVDLSPIAKALCDASSIESIHASNHTLQLMWHTRRYTDIGMPTLPNMIRTCLKLNKNANKDEVIRKKIARYYFIGEFDISPFANMPVSVLPEVLGLIEGGMPLSNRQSFEC